MMFPKKLTLILAMFALFMTFSFAVNLVRPATFVQPSTFCTGATNVSGQDVLRFSLNNVPYTVTENFVTPSSSGTTINGTSYTLSPNMPVTINSNTGAYVELIQVNYLPIQHSINFVLCSGQQGPATRYTANLSINNYGDFYFSYFGTKLLVTTNSSVDVPTNITLTNVTAQSPSAPSGYTKLLALNVSGTTGTSTKLNITQNVACHLSPNTVYVYKLLNGGWVQMPNSKFNATACQVSSIIPTFSTVGLFYNGQAMVNSSSTLSTSSTTSQSTSTTLVVTSTVNSTTLTTTVHTTSTTASTTSTTATTLTTTILPTTKMTTIAQNTTVQPTTINTTIYTTTIAGGQQYESFVSDVINEVLNWFKKHL
jgi:hypothetical protein